MAFEEVRSIVMFSLDVQKLKILIADDSENLRTRLRNLISKLNFVEVAAEVENAHEAIDKANTQHIDIAILDIEMPGSGIKALKKIKSSSPDTRVVMLTNHAGPFYRNTCLNAGADFFLDKSMQFEQLPNVLCELSDCDKL